MFFDKQIPAHVRISSMFFLDIFCLVMRNIYAYFIIFENNEKKQYRYWNSLPDKKSKLKLELHFNNATRFQTPCLYYAYT